MSEMRGNGRKDLPLSEKGERGNDFGWMKRVKGISLWKGVSEWEKEMGH